MVTPARHSPITLLCLLPVFLNACTASTGGTRVRCYRLGSFSGGSQLATRDAQRLDHGSGLRVFFVDTQNHVWVTHLIETLTPEELGAVQEPPIGSCCRPAPSIIEFDPTGAVIQGWGEPSDDISVYPQNPHGIFVGPQRLRLGRHIPSSSPDEVSLATVTSL